MGVWTCSRGLVQVRAFTQRPTPKLEEETLGCAQGVRADSSPRNLFRAAGPPALVKGAPATTCEGMQKSPIECRFSVSRSNASY